MLQHCKAVPAAASVLWWRGVFCWSRIHPQIDTVGAVKCMNTWALTQLCTLLGSAVPSSRVLCVLLVG